MKSVVLELVDESSQPVMKVPFQEYAVPAVGEETGDELDNGSIVARAEELIAAVLRRVQELKAEPAETPVRVRISISEALLTGAESQEPELTIVLKVRPRDET